jgi:hypothetical protein
MREVIVSALLCDDAEIMPGHEAKQQVWSV